MSTQKNTGSNDKNTPPDGAVPKHQSEQESARIRDEGKARSSGGGAERPDAHDEPFIEKNKN